MRGKQVEFILTDDISPPPQDWVSALTHCAKITRADGYVEQYVCEGYIDGVRSRWTIAEANDYTRTRYQVYENNLRIGAGNDLIALSEMLNTLIQGKIAKSKARRNTPRQIDEALAMGVHRPVVPIPDEYGDW